MIAQWMLYVAIVSLLLTVASYAAERLLRLWRRQARFVWCAAIALSIAIPLVSIAQAVGVLPAFDVAGVPRGVAGPVVALLPALSISASAPILDGVLATLWLVASAGLGLRFAAVARALRRRRAEWRTAMVDGHPVLVSRDAGPAVVGFRSPAIVVPDWVLGLDASLRSLVLTHEREHLERGDPRLLGATIAAAVCMPWNLVLWYQLARLRSAMELDCDARVLRAHPDARTYGSLLLAVAQRADRFGLLAPGLMESRSLLTRRIAAMRQAAPRHRVWLTAALASATVALGVVACDLRSPSDPAAAVPSVLAAEGAYFEFQVEQPATAVAGFAQPGYPDLARVAGVEGEILAQFVIDENGRPVPETFKVLKTSHEHFTMAVRNALPQMRFHPARVGDRNVRQLVQMPFTFTISR